MAKRSGLRPQLDERVTFLRGFLRNPQRVGSVIPSSRHLERRLVGLSEPGGANVVVELGCGTGGTTRALLDAMAAGARLLTIEIDPTFHARVQEIGDPRLLAHLGSAESLPDALAGNGLPPPELVVSGIPFSTMSEERADRILAAIAGALAPGGRFVAYQVRDRVEKLGSRYFGAAEVDVELLNVPPMRLFKWVKDAG